MLFFPHCRQQGEKADQYTHPHQPVSIAGVNGFRVEWNDGSGQNAPNKNVLTICVGYAINNPADRIDKTRYACIGTSYHKNPVFDSSKHAHR